MTARRLVLVRHAEAASALADRDRPLTTRGERQAAAVGEWLAAAGTAPDLVLVSPARRALQTWDAASQALPGAPERVPDERLYENTVELLLAVVREAGDDVRTVLVVGHNPSVGEAVRLLDDGEGTAGARERLGAGFPAGAAAAFAVPHPFADLDDGAAALVDVLVPRS